LTQHLLQAAEEKQRKKDQKKTKKSADSEGEDADEVDSNVDNANEVFAEVKALGLAQGFDGIASLSAKRLDNTKLKPRDVPMEVEEVLEEEIPVLINRDLPNLKAVLEEADVVIEVLDARDPLPFRSAHLEELASANPAQRVLLVLNKIGASNRLFVASSVLKRRP
jgi:nuclear GTP-binding protein